MSATQESAEISYERLDELLQGAGWYSGIPVSVPGLTVVGNTHVRALSQVIDENQRDEETDDGTFEDEEGNRYRIRNSWTLKRPWKRYRYGEVGVLENLATGRVEAMVVPQNSPNSKRAEFLFQTGGARMGSATVKAEETALGRIKEMLSDQQWRAYRLSDAFLELGRSGLRYLLRKNRPTIALRMGNNGGSILCALCLHPLAYYKDTWAGAMCPTDEVIAHLLHIRADEHFFWRKANQIPPDSPNSGI